MSCWDMRFGKEGENYLVQRPTSGLIFSFEELGLFGSRQFASRRFGPSPVSAPRLRTARNGTRGRTSTGKSIACCRTTEKHGRNRVGCGKRREAEHFSRIQIPHKVAICLKGEIYLFTRPIMLYSCSILSGIEIFVANSVWGVMNLCSCLLLQPRHAGWTSALQEYLESPQNFTHVMMLAWNLR